ncbi:MAG: NUDIX hydrolase [Candidatus Aenigmatarchaeota archaeon]
MKLKIRRVVGAFIRNKEGKWLIVHKDPNYLIKKKGYSFKLINAWEVLRGGIRKGETPLKTLRREFKEELGTTKFRNIKSLGIDVFMKEPKKYSKETGLSGHSIKIFYAEFYGKNSDIQLDKFELIDFKFLDEKRFLKKLKDNDIKTAFRKFLKKMKK